jgi:hypothetical protein
MKRLSIAAMCLSVVLLSTACGKQQKSQSAAESGPEQISSDEIELTSMRLGVDGDNESFHVMGMVQNNSQKLTLTELQVKVSLQDCLESGECQVIGEQVANIPTEVPAGQSKQFETHTKFKDLPQAKGTLGWHYAVVGAKSKAP